MGGDDKDRRRDRDRSRSRSRSRDRRRDRSRDRSRSRSRSPRREGGRKRKSLFDVGGPPGGAAAAVPGLFPAAAPAGFSAAPAGFSAAPTGFSAGGFSAPPSIPSIPGLPTAFPGMSGTVPGFPNMPLSMAPPPSQQATRHARRVYVGGLPPTASEQSIATFFSSALAAVGGASAGPGNAVVNVYINKEKNFAFVEFRTVEETSNAMALDGIMFEGVSVRVRRPNDYNPTAAAALGPAQPSATLNLAAIGLGAGKGTAPMDSGLMMMAGGVPSISTAMTRATENRIFVGGIPYYLTEEQCKELLGSFGAIKSFELIKDKETGQGKGYGFVVYQDPAVTDIAIAGLNGLKMGERTLTVRRAETGGVATNVLLQTHGISGAAAIGVPGVPPAPAGMPAGVPLPMAMPAAAPMMATSRIVVLQEAVTVEELANEEEYKDIVEDMKDECAKHGALNRVIIPRPTPTVPNPPGLGKVVVEYADVTSAMKARNSLNGRKFDGRTVIATFLPEEKYLRGEFDASAA